MKKTRGDWLEDLLRARSALVSGALLAALCGCSAKSSTNEAESDGDPATTDTHTQSPGATDSDAEGVRPDAAGTTPGGSGTAKTSDSGSKRSNTDAGAPPRIGDSLSDGGTDSDRMGSGDAGATGDAGGTSDADDCVEDPSDGGASASGMGSGNGKVYFYAPSGNSLVRLKTKLLVPKPPKKNAVLFLWPGLQPLNGGKNYNPIGTGVLQPVLTWGPSCAPNQIGEKYDSWWISAQYVNTLGNHQGYTGCHGGDSMKVAVGDVLDIDMSLSGTIWKQTVTDEQTGKSVDFDFDMMGQDQGWALFVIEDTYNSPSEDVIFKSSVLTYASPAPMACTVGTRGVNDFVAKPRSLKNGLECCIPRIVLRARGVAATSPN